MLLQNEGKINIFSDIKQQKILNWSAVDILTGNVKGSPSSRRKMVTEMKNTENGLNMYVEGFYGSYLSLFRM